MVHIACDPAFHREVLSKRQRTGGANCLWLKTRQISCINFTVVLSIYFERAKFRRFEQLDNDFHDAPKDISPH
jgi:hypothetical protein